MDRLDCQFIMGLYTCVHYYTFVRQPHPSVAAALALAAHMTDQEQLALAERLVRSLVGRGLLTAEELMRKVVTAPA